MLYNRPNNPYYRAAARFKNSAQPILDNLTPLTPNPVGPGQSGSLQSQDQASTPSLVGDLEAPLPILRLLLSTPDLQDSVDFVLDSNPITSLFSFELEKPKPLPPPPPPHSGKSKKRLSKAELRARRAERERQRKLDAAPGFMGPKTRRMRGSDAAGESSVDAVAAAVASASESAVQSEAEAAETVPVTEQTAEEVAAALELKRKKERENKKQRRMAIEAELLAMPLVVEPDKKETFKMFNQGWVLPAGTKRGGRVPVERAYVPPPPPRPRNKKGGQFSCRSCSGG